MTTISERAAFMIQFLGMADDYHDPCPGRDHITGLEHALRLAAMLEHRSTDPMLQFAGLVHDLARPLNDVHHGEIVAEIVRDRVPPFVYHLLRTHGDYQDAVVHGKPYPVQPADVRAECQPHNMQRLALMFAACEAMTFDPEYTNELGPTPWPYARARQAIIDVLN